MEKITGETTVAKILDIPGNEKILIEHRFPCVTCPMAKFEIEKLKLGEVCNMYGIDLDGILNDLNQEKK